MQGAVEAKEHFQFYERINFNLYFIFCICAPMTQECLNTPKRKND